MVVLISKVVNQTMTTLYRFSELYLNPLTLQRTCQVIRLYLVTMVFITLWVMELVLSFSTYFHHFKSLEHKQINLQLQLTHSTMMVPILEYLSVE
jgi:hypothetical protein